MNYYNDNDPKTAEWLRQLILAGLIPNGVVDDRSIEEVKPSDLNGYTQCHFFAGIGGWSLALQIAGWPETKQVWTGSCPCQPFSNAGRGRTTEDERHLWPVFADLIEKCRPPTVYGEQVASPAGRDWLTGVLDDLEKMEYSTAAIDLCSAGVFAPHLRQRLFWVGHAPRFGRGQGGRISRDNPDAEESGQANHDLHAGEAHHSPDIFSDPEQLLQWKTKLVSAFSGQYADFRDGKKRRIPNQPALFPVADGFPYRVGLLRGAGNAIVPQAAAAFVVSTMNYNE